MRINAQIREESGGFDAVRCASPSRLHPSSSAHVRPASLRVLTLHTEAEPPNRIDGMGIRPLAPRTSRPPRSPTARSRARRLPLLEDYQTGLVSADAFSGAVLVASRGRADLRARLRQASKSYDVPNAVDTKFNLGSMNKMFTAVAIAQLVEKGVLSWDDPIGKWLGSDWVRPEVGEKATIRHL